MQVIRQSNGSNVAVGRFAKVNFFRCCKDAMRDDGTTHSPAYVFGATPLKILIGHDVTDTTTWCRRFNTS